MNNSDSLLQTNIQYLMAQQGIDGGTELARRSGLQQPTVHRILKGESRDPKISNLKSIAEVFGVPFWQLTEVDMQNVDSADQMEQAATAPRDRSLTPGEILTLRDAIEKTIDRLYMLDGVEPAPEDIARGAVALFNRANKANEKVSNIAPTEVTSICEAAFSHQS